MFSGNWRRVATALAVCAQTFFACTFSRTQTVFEIHADQRVLNEATEIRIEVRSASDAVLFTRLLHPMSSEFSGFPITLPISAKNGDDSRSFEVRIAATTQRRQGTSVTTDTLAENRVRTGFRRGKVLRFSLWLLSGCRCNIETERCEPDADGDLVPECVTQTIDVNGQDVAVAEDAGLDGNHLDASTLDANTFDTTVLETGPVCQGNQHVCDGHCVSISSPIACGPSCLRCVAIPGGEPSCDDNSCGITCSSSTPDRCPSACVNLENDTANCGTCGNACPNGQLCVNRGCQAPPQCTRAEDPACTGMSYCNTTTRMCAPGCDGRSGQCPSNTVCDTNTHTCNCNGPNRMCGSVCAVCPTNTSNSTGFTCDGTACILSGCNQGYVRTNNNTVCSDVNECNTNNGGCGLAYCTNTAGGRTCQCRSPNLECGNSCVACPSDANQTTTGCRANACVIVACSDGFRPNQQGTVCEASVPPGTLVLATDVSLTVRPSGTNSFGSGLAISHDRLELAVGSWSGEEGTTGVVHIHRRADTTQAFPTVPTQTIQLSGQYFGVSLSYRADDLELAIGDRSLPRAVHLFRRTNATQTFSTTPVQSIREIQGNSRDFGSSVVYSTGGLELSIGDRSHRIYSYRRSEVSQMFPSTPTTTLAGPPGDFYFGETMSCRNDGLELAVGDSSYENGIAGDFNPGVVLFYRRNDTAQEFPTTPIQILTNPARTPGVFEGPYGFGKSAAYRADGLEIAVGGTSNRLVYVFRRASISQSFPTTPSQTLTGPSPSWDFATSIVYDGQDLLIGDNDSTAGTGPGRGVVWVFERM